MMFLLVRSLLQTIERRKASAEAEHKELDRLLAQLKRTPLMEMNKLVAVWIDCQLGQANSR